MSFFYASQSKSIKNNMLLGHSQSNKLSLQLMNQPILGNEKRTFLSTLLTGSITVEAAISLPVFLFTMISLMYFFNIIFLQLSLQIQLENIARLISASTCVTSEIEEYLEDDESTIIEDVIIDTAGTIAIKQMFLTDEIGELVNNSLIVDGTDGLSFFGSDVTNVDYELDILLSYKVRMPFIPEDIFTFDLTNRCYFRPFNGKELKRNIYLDKRYVYIATNGDVFHSSKYCSHLERFTFLKPLNELLTTYPSIQPCSFCKTGNSLINRPQLDNTTYVYITSECDVYHLIEACPALQRNLIKMLYSDAEKIYTPCNRCNVYTN